MARKCTSGVLFRTCSISNPPHTIRKVSAIVALAAFAFMLLPRGIFWLSAARTFLAMASSEGYVAGTYVVAYVTVPNETVGKQLARKIVTEKLAACVNILPKITSVYEWQGKVEEEGESLLIIKTRSSRVDDLTAFVKANHPYDVPEVISLPIENGSGDYLTWLGANVPEREESEKSVKS